MPSDDPQAAATKYDLRLLKEDLRLMFKEEKEDLHLLFK